MKGGVNMNKKILVGILATALIGGVLVQNSMAATSAGNGVNSLVKAIAERFKLNETDVQKVFDEHRQTIQKEHEQNFITRLDTLVKEGKITQAQKQLIITKRNELETQRINDKDSFKNLTEEQRETKIQQRKAEIDAWAKTNNIDPSYLMGGKGMGRHMNKPFSTTN